MRNYFNRQANFCMDKSLRDIAHLREGYRYVTAKPEKKTVQSSNVTMTA